MIFLEMMYIIFYMKSIKSKNQNNQKKKIDKKVSLKDAMTKIVSVVKKPFSKNKKTTKDIANRQQSTKRQRKETILIQKKQQQNKDQQNTNDETIVKSKNYPKQFDVPFAENSTITQLSKFFYSNDRFIDTFDDMQLYESMTKHYPEFLDVNNTEQIKRKIVIDILNDNEFMNDILEKYNMKIMDFFRFLFRLCPSIFKGFFVKKIQKTIKNKKYAKSVKFATYRFQKGRKKNKSSRKCSLL